MTKIKLSKLSRSNRMYIKEHLQECGLDCLDIELRNEEELEFADEITICNFDSELKNKLSESRIQYDEWNFRCHFNTSLYKDIKNDVVQTKYAKKIGYLYLIQDNVTYKVDVVAKKLNGRVNKMLDFTFIERVDDDKVPLLTPERFVLVRGFNAKHYFVYDGIEDMYYWTSDMLNEELEERDTEEEREKLILEDTSWFVDKDVFLDDCDL